MGISSSHGGETIYFKIDWGEKNILWRLDAV